MTNLPELYIAAQQFRSALEKCERHKLPVSFESFPQGSCGDAALLLAKYLEKTGFGKFNYVLGRRNEMTHAWLENNDSIVDISADQFAEISEQVIVENKSKWHVAFGGQVQNVADFEIYDEHTSNTLRSAYNAIVVHLPPKNA